MLLNPVKWQNPLPWAVRPFGVAPASHPAAMSCKQQPEPPALKCCNGCVTIGPRKANAAAKVTGAAMVVAVAPKGHGATQTVHNQRVRKAPVVRRVIVMVKVEAAAPTVIASPSVTPNRAAMKDVLQTVAWANPVRPALQPVDNRTRCVPVSI